MKVTVKTAAEDEIKRINADVAKNPAIINNALTFLLINNRNLTLLGIGPDMIHKDNIMLLSQKLLSFDELQNITKA